MRIKVNIFLMWHPACGINKVWTSAFLSYLDRVKRICVFEHSVMTNFNCACPAIQRGQGSGLLSEGSSWLTACMSEQQRFWRDCADAQACLNLHCSHRRWVPNSLGAAYFTFIYWKGWFKNCNRNSVQVFWKSCHACLISLKKISVECSNLNNMKHCTPHTIIGVQANFCVSYPICVISRVKCIGYIGNGVQPWSVLYPKPCFNELCYKEAEV